MEKCLGYKLAMRETDVDMTSTYIAVRISKYKGDAGNIFYRVSALKDQAAIDFFDEIPEFDTAAKKYAELQTKYYGKIIAAVNPAELDQ